MTRGMGTIEVTAHEESQDLLALFGLQQERVNEMRVLAVCRCGTYTVLVFGATAGSAEEAYTCLGCEVAHWLTVTVEPPLAGAQGHPALERIGRGIAVVALIAVLAWMVWGWITGRSPKP